jgi:CRP/FNR family cyclic AMP-dependent transcriptional regulator
VDAPIPIGPFGEMLSAAERREFVARARAAHYERGEILFREDDVTRHAVLIESGSVKITRRRPDHADMILALRGASDLVGEMAAIDGTPRSASAIAMGPVDVHVIEAAAFESFVRANDSVAWILLRSMAERQRDADQRRVDQASQSVTRRVAALLVDMDERRVGIEAGDDGLDISQTELAEAVGATREAVAKTLAELRKIGAITTARRRLKIADHAKLDESSGK